MTSKEKLFDLALEGFEGRHWYSVAAKSISDYCATRKCDPEVFIKSLAVLSPQISVEQNIKLAIASVVCNEEPNVVRSVRVGYERLRDSGYMLAAIKGPKTSRFARALLGDPTAVTLDTHMGYALNVPATKLKNKSIQAEAEKRIVWVANRLRITPAQTQAAIWCGQRKRAGLTGGHITPELLIKQTDELVPF
jgi:hypothetical protein